MKEATTRNICTFYLPRKKDKATQKASERGCKESWASEEGATDCIPIAEDVDQKKQANTSKEGAITQNGKRMSDP